MEVNPDDCGQPTVSDILGALPLCIRPPSSAPPLPLLPLPLEGIMSPVGSLDVKMPSYSVRWFADYQAWCNQRRVLRTGEHCGLAFGRKQKSRVMFWQRAGCEWVWKHRLLTLKLLKSEKAVWGRKHLYLNGSNKPPSKQVFLHFRLKSRFSNLGANLHNLTASVKSFVQSISEQPHDSVLQQWNKPVCV